MFNGVRVSSDDHFGGSFDCGPLRWCAIRSEIDRCTLRFDVQGTRKRLVSSLTSASSAARVSSPESITAAPASEQPNGSNNHKAYGPDNTSAKAAQKYKPNYGENERSPKRLKESASADKQSQPLSPPLMQAALAAAVAAAANASHPYPVRPLNVHSAKMNSNCSRLMNTSSLCTNPMPRNANAMSSDLAVSFCPTVHIASGAGVLTGRLLIFNLLPICRYWLSCRETSSWTICGTRIISSINRV